MDMDVGTGRYGYGMRKEAREEGGRERGEEGRQGGRKEGVEKRRTRETRTKAFQVGIGIPGVCFPCHTIPSVFQPQVVYSYKKIIEKKEKKKKNQISVVNSDDITRYYNYAKTIKVSLPDSLFLFLPLFLLLLEKAKEWNQYEYLGRESGMNIEEENPIIQYFW